MRATMPTIWCVGGLDTSGGAGLARDAVVTGALHCQYVQAITTISAQTHDTSFEVISLASHFEAQLRAISRMPPSAIKLGVISEPGISVLVDALKGIRQHSHDQNTVTVPVIWDPVLSSSAGGNLSELSVQAVKALLPYIDIITPNLLELSTLTGHKNPDTAIAWLHQAGVTNVVVKGGHSDNSVATDHLYTPHENWSYTSNKHPVTMRGTGCMFATALACFMAHDYILEDAVCLAKALINQTFRNCCTTTTSVNLAGPVNWPYNVDDFPLVTQGTVTLPFLTFDRLTHTTPGLYPIVSDCNWLERVLKTGVHIAQLRIKEAPPDVVESQISEAVALGRRYHAQVFINDHWELAIKYKAFGVHLGQEDLHAADLGAICQAGLRLGVSTHGYAELCRVLPLSPSYVALGHIFATQTKVMPSAPQGIERLARYRHLCGNIPSVAIGGIGRAQVEEVWATGVDGIAMVSAITQSPSPEQTIVEIQHLLGNERGEHD